MLQPYKLCPPASPWFKRVEIRNIGVWRVFGISQNHGHDKDLNIVGLLLQGHPPRGPPNLLKQLFGCRILGPRSRGLGCMLQGLLRGQRVVRSRRYKLGFVDYLYGCFYEGSPLKGLILARTRCCFYTFGGPFCACPGNNQISTMSGLK